MSGLYAGRKYETKDIFGDRLEGLNQDRKIDFGRDMFVPYHDHRTPFRAFVFCKLVAVTNRTNIAWVRMK